MLRLRRAAPVRPERRSAGALVKLVVALRLVADVSDALADESCPTGGSWVRVEVQGAPPEFARRVLEDLRAGLAASRVGACDEDVAGTPPLAVVRVAPSASKPSRYGIDVSDAVTQKRLARDVDLDRVPPDGRAFAIAVAADELLRASWAELALRERKREEKSPVAPPRAPPPDPSAAASAPPRHERERDALGAHFAIEHYAHGQTQFGGDVFWSRRFAPWLGLALSLGARRGLDTDSEHGRVQSSALGAELALEPRLLSLGAVSLNLPIAVRGARATFSGEALGDNVAKERSGLALYARGGLSLVVLPAGAFLSRTSAGAGAPLRSFSASDAGERVTGMGGLELYASTGIAVEF